MTTTPESALKQLFSISRSLHLASVNEDGSPHASYTPFCRINGDFVIFISQLSRHTANLLSQKRVAAMIIADEAQSTQIFARVRATFQCRVDEVGNDNAGYEGLLDQYEKHLGKTVTLLRQLPDFVLFRLIPESGHLVMGFGEAFEMTGENLSEFNHVKSVN